MNIGEESYAEVITQLPIVGGYIDLNLKHDTHFNAAVEIKVGSMENCDHHRTQLQRYRSWLDSDTKYGHLFTLVRDPDRDFHPEAYGAKRLLWRDLNQYLNEVQRNKRFSEVEVNLIKYLSDYLETEGIVTNHEGKDLLAYSKGIKAHKTVVAILSRVAERLEIERFKCTVNEGGTEVWPHLQVEQPKWSNIFGEGENRKVTIWFMVPGIWGAERHDFAFEIELWNQEHGNDWNFIKARVPKWLKTLANQGFCSRLSKTWSRDDKCDPASIDYQPKRIFVYKEEPLLNQTEPQSAEALIELLLSRAKHYARIVSALKR